MADETLRKTPLHALHECLGARMTGFAGYDMPLQYKLGVMKEHLHCREAAGLFDVSHMGQVVLRAKSGSVGDAARALERIVPQDIVALRQGRQRYALFTNEEGGIRDDLMVATRADHLFLVVNAACKDADIAHMREHLSGDCEIAPLEDRALIALQGPAAAAVLGDAVAAMKFMDVADVELFGVACWVSRSGYTGEDGFEISLPADAAEDFAAKLVEDARVEPIGLGARDSLRLEAGLCLYGNDIDESTSPVEAALEWAIQKARKPGGEREGGFPGEERILAELRDGAARRRVGLSPEGRAPVRQGAPVHGSEALDGALGEVTSGAFGPSVGAPVAMGYVPTASSAPGTALAAELRGKPVPVTVAELPFIPANFKR